MEPGEPISVLIVDDHPVVREGLAAMIQRRDDMAVAATAADGAEALELFRLHRPDVTLMDLRMPVMDGVSATQAIRGEFPDARVIVLTTYDGDASIMRALQAGAVGYLLKDAGREDLLAAIRSVHAGKRQIPPDVAARLAEHLGERALTEREMEVLRSVATGLSNKEIGAALLITEGTVKAHVNSILGKLGANDRTQAVTVALRRGLIHLD